MPRKSYEDEIRELLNRMDSFLPEERRRRRWDQRYQWNGRLGAWWRRSVPSLRLQPLTPQKLMAVSIVLMLFSWVFTLFQPKLAAAISLVSVVLFLAALVLAIRAGVSPRLGYGGEPRWRGKVIHLPSRNWAWRLRRWWQTKRKY